MVSVSIIGSGNVAQHLALAFFNSLEIEMLQVYSRSEIGTSLLPDSIEIVNDFDELKFADLYVIAVSDSAIADVSSSLPFENRLVAHTSGSVSINELNSKNKRAVFYPLQTFSKNKKVDFTIIPICLESENDEDYKILEAAANAISENVYTISSEQRKSLHVSAVFVNNFTNHLYRLAEEICEEQHVPFEILKPLILETADKVMTLSPKDAQTGPAKRNDQNTIHSHLDFLLDDNRKNIYQLLTQSIIDDGKKL